MGVPKLPDWRDELVCRVCGVSKHVDEYHASKTYASGYDPRCKPCESKRASAYARTEAGKANAARSFAKRRADPEAVERYRLRSLEFAATITKNQRMFSSAKARAKKLGLAFTISISDVVIPETCPLLGTPIVPGKGTLHAGSPSLDRIDPSLGYVPGNVWVISYRANAIKQNASLEEIEMLASNLRRITG